MQRRPATTGAVVHGRASIYVGSNVTGSSNTTLRPRATRPTGGSPRPVSGNDSVVLSHNFGFPPSVYLLKQVGLTWVDATGTADVVHNAAFTTTTITNTTAFAITFLIRLL